LIDRCVGAARQHHQVGVLARVLGIAAQLAAARGDYPPARRLSDEGLPLVRVTAPRWSEARYLDALALLAIEQGDFEGAATWLSSSLDASRTTGDAWSEAAALNKLGDVKRAQGDYALAGPKAFGGLKIRATSCAPACCTTWGMSRSPRRTTANPHRSLALV
jgi:hypothetical protein